MNDLDALTQIDFKLLFIWICLILVCAKFIGTTIEWVFVDKLGLETKGMRKKREDHDLLVKTAENLVKLQERHESDERYVEDCLSCYIEETRKETKQLTDAVNTLIGKQDDSDEKIKALVIGSKELLGDTIDQRYDKYILLKGIPQNEVDEFDDIYTAYKGLGGNHGRDAKYNYVKQHLPVIPVKTELLTDMK